MTEPQQPGFGQQPPPSKKDAKAQAAAAKAYSKSQRSWFARHKILTGLGALIALMVVIGIASSGGSGGSGGTDAGDTATDSGESSAPAASKKPEAPKVDETAKNITIDTCGVTDLGGTKFAKIAYTVNNPTSKSSSYFFQVALIDSTGAVVSQASGIEPNVLPGRPSKGEASGNVSDSAVKPYTCEVSNVTRTADN